MAIPFYVPSDEETVNNYRSMDDLWWQLCDVLRQILLHQTPVEIQRNNVVDVRTTPRAERRDVPDLVADLPLPDLVQCSTTTSATGPRRPHRRHEATPVAPPRRRRRRPTHKAAVAVDDVHHVLSAPRTTCRLEADGLRKVEMRDNWTQVGDDLRLIAEDFHATLQNLEHPKTSPESPAGNKGVSLVSLLVSGGPLWMAVIVLLGWGAIQRTR